VIAWILLLPTLAFSAATLLIAAWRMRERRSPAPPAGPRDLPAVSVLVAARNEEARLARCLAALAAQDYPADRLTIFVADDHSTDGTAEVVRGFARERRPDEPAVRLVSVPDASGDLRGKAHAIHAAIQESTDELLLITDADCAPPPTWARTMAGAFADPAVGIVSAPTTIDPLATEASPLLRGLQALDWTYLLTACAFLVEIGRPVTAMGNNMAFRRTAYDAVGGYPALRFSVTEDYELFRTILAQTGWRARFLVGRGARVLTLPLTRLADVYMQRRRWARGGLRAPAGVWAAYLTTHLAHLLPLLVLPFAPGPALLAIGLKAGADLALLAAAVERDNRPALRAFPAWQAYLFAYTVSLPAVLLLSPRIDWKDRRL
jgi:1,2-diacylglycerol 3-beta-glucosyltransferase